ncbi:MAG: alpha/beta fold hydrolase [Planctomycetes bacterium]|nr:alpha/beta fold hydrolase [Planctomycetota bacterium]
MSPRLVFYGGMFGGLIILLLLALGLLIAILTAAVMYVSTHPPRRTAGTAIAHGQPTDPAEAGARSYETITVKATDGVPIEVWLVEGERTEGPIIVMLHGWGDARIGELAWFDVLKGCASELVMFDQRGHGESKHARCTLGRAEAGDVLTIIEALRHHGRRGRIVLFGYSMGAIVAMRAAGMSTEIAGVIADSPYRYLAEAVRGMLRSNATPTWPMVELAQWLLGLSHEDTAAMAGRMAQRVLIMHGTHDAIAPLADARAIATAAGERATLVEFEEAGHLEAGCAHAAEYARAIASFVETRAQ